MRAFLLLALLVGLTSPALALAPERAVRLYLGDAPADSHAATALARALGEHPAVELIGDPTAEAPDHTLAWTAGSWQLTYPDGSHADLGFAPNAAAVAAALRPPPHGPARLWLRLPPPAALRASLQADLGARGLDLVADPAEADYLLAGRAVPEGRSASGTEYAWVLRAATVPAPARTLLPLASRWYAPEAAAPLERYAATLAQAWAWGQRTALALPTFPYELAGTSGPAALLQATPVAMEGAMRRVLARPEGATRHYVYLYRVEADGTARLVPAADGGPAHAVEATVQGCDVRLPLSEAAPADAPFVVLVAGAPIEAPELALEPAL